MEGSTDTWVTRASGCGGGGAVEVQIQTGRVNGGQIRPALKYPEGAYPNRQELGQAAMEEAPSLCRSSSLLIHPSVSVVARQSLVLIDLYIFLL